MITQGSLSQTEIAQSLPVEYSHRRIFTAELGEQKTTSYVSESRGSLNSIYLAQASSQQVKDDTVSLYRWESDPHHPNNEMSRRDGLGTG